MFRGNQTRGVRRPRSAVFKILLVGCSAEEDEGG